MATEERPRRWALEHNGIWHAVMHANHHVVGLCRHVFRSVRTLPAGETPPIAEICCGCRGEIELTARHRRAPSAGSPPAADAQG